MAGDSRAQARASKPGKRLAQDTAWKTVPLTLFLTRFKTQPAPGARTPRGAHKLTRRPGTAAVGAPSRAAVARLAAAAGPGPCQAHSCGTRGRPGEGGWKGRAFMCNTRRTWGGGKEGGPAEAAARPGDEIGGGATRVTVGRVVAACRGDEIARGTTRDHDGGCGSVQGMARECPAAALFEPAAFRMHAFRSIMRSTLSPPPSHVSRDACPPTSGRWHRRRTGACGGPPTARPTKVQRRIRDDQPVSLQTTMTDPQRPNNDPTTIQG
eukprot:363727-Chlamydomonas_euryale.AAC.1